MTTTSTPSASRVRSRSAALDAVRIAAVVAVVLGHTRGGRTAAELTFSWHVPVFFILSGYLLTSQRDAATELRRRTQSILVPTAAWGIIVTLVWCVHLQRSGGAFDGFWRRLAWGGSALGAPYSPFWFMPVLVAAVVLTRLLAAFPYWGAWAVALAGYLLCWEFPRAAATSFWSIMLAPACMLFVLAGQELRRRRHHVRFPFLTGAALLAFSFVSVGVIDITWVNIKQGSFGTFGWSTIDAFTISAGLILIAEATLQSVPSQNRIARAITRVAATSLPVILGHMLVMSLRPKPWTWTEIGLVMVGLWMLGLLISLNPRVSKLLL